MPEPPISVVVLIVCYNGRDYLEDCLASVLASDDGGIARRVVVVDNASTDGSADLVRDRWPQVDLVPSETNLGFAGGNNLGWEHARRAYPGCRYLALLNQDTVVRGGWLAALVDHLERRPHVAVAQPKLLLHPDTDRINTAGNRSHYLGFGFMTGYREPDDGWHDAPRAIDYASGAALLVRTDLLERVGLFDEALFMYLEDAELSWKARQVGAEVEYVPAAVVCHKYAPTAPYRHYEHLERNRWILLLTYYRLRTLLLIAPALALMEGGQWLFAVRHGLLRARWRAYAYFLNPRRWAELRAKRRAAQARRVVGDRRFLGGFAGTIRFEAVQSPLLTWVANPLLGAWWGVVRRLIVW